MKLFTQVLILMGSISFLHAGIINVTKYETTNSCDQSVSFYKMRFATCMVSPFYGTTCAPYIYQSGYINGCYYSPALSINAFMDEEEFEQALTYAQFTIVSKSGPEDTE